MIDTGTLYLEATLQCLRENRTLFVDENIAKVSCLVMPDDKTPPNAGYLFLGVRLVEQRSVTETPKHLHERVSISVGITIRTSDTPTDRLGTRQSSRSRDADKRITIQDANREVLQTVHSSDKLLGICQELILAREPEQGRWPAMNPLMYDGTTSGGVQTVTADHFGADDAAASGAAGLYIKLSFRGGERFQAL